MPSGTGRRDWRWRSGVPEKGVVGKFHFAIFEALRYMITVDQLDPTQLVAAEYLARWAVCIEMATQKNPKQPDWEGLDVLVNGRLKDTGAAEIPVFTAWLTTQQQAQAQIMKQGRLLREERAAEKKRQNPKKEGE